MAGLTRGRPRVGLGYRAVNIEMSPSTMTHLVMISAATLVVDITSTAAATHFRTKAHPNRRHRDMSGRQQFRNFTAGVVGYLRKDKAYGAYRDTAVEQRYPAGHDGQAEGRGLQTGKPIYTDATQQVDRVSSSNSRRTTT